MQEQQKPLPSGCWKQIARGTLTQKESPSLPQKPENYSELVLWGQATPKRFLGHKPMLGRHHSQAGSPKNTYCVEEAAQYMTEDRSSRFFSTNTVWNRSVNTVKPTWLCPGNILYGWRKMHHSRQWYPLSLQWCPRELSEKNVSRIHF